MSGEQRERSGVSEMTSPTDRLGQLAELALEAGLPELANDATTLSRRLAEGRFYVACIGQFKRGKSTLLNALVGHPVLPMGVLPVTTAVTVVRYGAVLRARVRQRGTWFDIALDQVADFVSEERNPANEKGVELVEVYAPRPLLASGMCFVDTPGIGSVIAANTDTTKSFVPHIDAAIVVLGADPPITGEELALVEEIAQQVPELIVVLNKADRATPEERKQAAAFARKLLAQRLGRVPGRIFEVSALTRLTSHEATGDWEALERTLETLATSAGAHLVARAEVRGVTRLGERLLHEIAAQRYALERPLAESEERIRTLRACVATATQALQDLGYLLTAEQDRLHSTLRQQVDQFVARSLPLARAELLRQLSDLTGRRAEVRQRALRLAEELAIQRVEQWLVEATPAAEALYRKAMERFVSMANEFLERLANSRDELSSLPRSVDIDLGFRSPSRMYYTSLMHLTGRSPWRWLLDTLLPPQRARRRIEQEALARLERLLRANAYRVSHDLDERARESRQRLESELRASLRQICTSTERALERARNLRQAGQAAVDAELRRLEKIRYRVEALLRHKHDAAFARTEDRPAARPPGPYTACPT